MGGAACLPTTDEDDVRPGTQACLPPAAYPQPRSTEKKKEVT